MKDQEIDKLTWKELFAILFAILILLGSMTAIIINIQEIYITIFILMIGIFLGMKIPVKRPKIGE